MDILENKIREINREILRLKTSHPMASGIKTFWAEFHFDLEAYDPPKYKNYYYEITYSEGEQPIITGIYAKSGSNTWLGMFVLEAPVGNKQIMVIWDTGYGDSVDPVLNSTRQILGVRRISAP